LVGVTASTGSPLSGGSFTVLGDKSAEYTAGVNFRIVGSTYNDGNYTVVSTITSASPIETTQINVTGIVPTNNVEGFVSVQDATNSGTFDVIASAFAENLVVPFTTVFLTGISLLPPVLTDSNQRFVSYVNTQPLEYSQILSYSAALKDFETSSPPSQHYVADEGLLIAPIVDVSATSFSILGDYQSSNIFVGDEFIVGDSATNNGTYNITALVYEYSATATDFVTTFSVTTVPDLTIDGEVRLNIPSNVFIIEGADYTRFYVQGSRLNATTGSHEGIYTTLNSKFINNKTYVRVRQTLIPEGEGLLILSTGANYISVDGDVTSIYNGSPAQQFNIVASLRNDGSYTSAGATYDGPTNTTQISIVEPFDVTDASGEIHEFTKGSVTYLPEGFGGTLDLCEIVPPQLAVSTIDEDIEFLLGHKYIIDGTESGTNKIYIKDNDTADVYNAFINGTTGSPAELSVEIISSGINNGTYTITNVETDPSVHAILTVSAALLDSGIFSGSPTINSGYLKYREWYQYYVTYIDTSNNDFIVSGDATADISNGDSIQHIFTDGIYTVNAAPIFDGTNTTISVTQPIVIIGYYGTASPQVMVDITAGSPAFDDWIISI